MTKSLLLLQIQLFSSITNDALYFIVLSMRTSKNRTKSNTNTNTNREKVKKRKQKLF